MPILTRGTGHDNTKTANRSVYDSITLTPQFLRGRVDPDISVKLFGKTYQAPFGVSPIGLSSMIWPGAELILAKAAKAHGFPYALSTVAGESIERVSAVGGDMAWFQLYAPFDRTLCSDLLRRAADCGCETIILTADVPAPEPARANAHCRCASGKPGQFHLLATGDLAINDPSGMGAQNADERRRTL